mgnify:CR=1 FL=1
MEMAYTSIYYYDSISIFYITNFISNTKLMELNIHVSGVGTSTARTMLSSLNPEQVIDAISSNNVSIVQSKTIHALKNPKNCIIYVFLSF